MTDLTTNELILVNGGNVPTAYYLDSDTMNANWKNVKNYFSFVAGVIVGFFD